MGMSQVERSFLKQQNKKHVNSGQQRDIYYLYKSQKTLFSLTKFTEHCNVRISLHVTMTLSSLSFPFTGDHR